MIVTRQPGRLHEMFISLKVFAIDIAPPIFIGRKVVKIITPLAKLDRAKSVGFFKRGQGGFIVPVENARASLNLHVGASRVGHDRPADSRKVFKKWFRGRPRGWTR